MHMPGKKKNVIFSDEATDDSISEGLDKNSMLIEYFVLNQRDEDARKCMHSMIP